VTVTVPVTGITVSPATLSLTTGQTGQVNATITPANATNKSISWSSSNTSVATVSITGLVTSVSPGTANITVTSSDGGFTSTCAVTVTAPVVPVTGVLITPEAITLAKGATSLLTANIQPVNATNKKVTWSSINTLVATVNEKGEVSALNGGQTIIFVTTEDGGYTDTCSVRVIVPVTGVTMNPTSLSIMEGNEINIYATVAPADASNKNIFWTSNNASVARVSIYGLVTALSPGTATITVTTEDGAKTATCVVTVTAAPVAVTGVFISPESLTLNRGDNSQLTANIQPVNATNKKVTWSSSNSNVATVNEKGLVNALAGGQAIIFVTTEEGSFTDTCSVNVIVPVSGVTLNPTSFTIMAGNEAGLTATVSPADATNKAVAWSSSNTNVATVNAFGLVQAKAVGMATITVTTVDGSRTATCAVTVTAAPVAVTGVVITPETLVMHPSGSYQLNVSISPKNATNQNVIWSSSNSRNVSVNQNGLVTMAARSNGGATITVTTEDGDYTATCEVSLYVSVTGITLDKDVHYMPTNRTTITAPVTATVLPSSASDQSITWSSSNGLIATVSSTGNLTSRLTGICTITATTNDGGFSASYTLYVGSRVTGVTLNKASTYLYAPNYADASNPSSEQLIATIEPANAVNKNVTWSSSNPAIATVDQKGVVTVITTEHHKQCTITVTTQDGSKTASCVVHVNVIN
jgi:uncharacterized protein YjdB